MAKGKQKFFYAVAKGEVPGVYETWFGADGAEPQIKNYPGALFRKFPTRKEALEWMKNPKPKYNTSASSKKSSGATVAREVSSDTVIVYTDGGALNNPGPGGYGAVLLFKGKRKELSGGFRKTTNNRMELTGAIEALKSLKQTRKVLLHTDSQYVVNGITKGWAKRWRQKGWMRNKDAPAENYDLWEKLLDLCDEHKVDFQWVKGHAGNTENERCDVLAKAAAANSSNQETDVPYETGRTTVNG